MDCDTDKADDDEEGKVDEHQDKSDETEEKDQATCGKQEKQISIKCENERKFEKDMAAIKSTKPWLPILEQLRDKPRSYSDTSQMRVISKATEEDIRSCASYMHFPHISGQLKRIRELQGSSSTPHLHHSFSRMHLPHITDPWDPGEDYPTVSVIALAEERERINTEDAIVEKEVEWEDDITMSDDDNEDEVNEATVDEHAIYTWNREMGRTRSLSEPATFLAQTKEDTNQRPRALSLESVDKAKKPPSRLQLQMTLSGLEEESSQSILLLAESSELISEPDVEPAQANIESNSSDEILTRWTRHDFKRRSTSFSSDLTTIDENKVEIKCLQPPIVSDPSDTPSLQALVDEITKDVIDRSSDGRIVSTGDPSENESEDSTAYVDPTSVLKRRLSLPHKSPLRKTQPNYATKMEREAFDKISQWKTKFASKLEDILRKGVDSEVDEKVKSVKSVVVDVPMHLSAEQLQDLKKNMIGELKRKSNQGDVKEILLTPQESRRFQPKIRREPSNNADEFMKISSSHCHKETKLDPSELLERLHHLQRQTRSNESSPRVSRGFDGITDAKEKISELMNWHDQERNNLQQEMEMMLIAENYSSASSLPPVSIDKESLERVCLSLQTVTDAIFKETISRLKGTISNGIVTAKEQNYQVEKVGKYTQPVVKDKHFKDAICQTSPKQTQSPVAIKTSSPKATNSSIDDTSTEKRDIICKLDVPNHVHSTSIGEHFCHKKLTCVGAGEDTGSSLYTAETSAHSCECDFASEENNSSDKEASTSEQHKFGMQSSITTMDSSESETTKAPEIKQSSHFSFYSSVEENELDGNESDACSEIADLLGVYQVYNLNNERGDSELARPQAPEPMTFKERDALEKIKRQKIQLKSYKRKIREFKNKNKRLKEQARQLELQQREWREDYLIKDNRISDLKREVDHLSIVIFKYKKALEDKSNIIKHKERQIVSLLLTEQGDSGDISNVSPLRDRGGKVKEVMDDNVSLLLQLNNKGKGEDVLLCDDALSSEFQAKLESAYKMTSELEQELRESKEKLSNYIAENESIFGEEDVSTCVDNLRKTIIVKDKKIQELKNQHSEEIQELTEEIHEVMTERDRLVEQVSEMSPLMKSDDLQKRYIALEEEVKFLRNALIVEMKSKEKAEGYDLPVSSMEQGASGSSKDEEVKMLREALKGYKIMTQRLLECKEKDGEDTRGKFETMAWLAQHCEHVESELREVLTAKENEIARLQDTNIRLQNEKQHLQDMNAFADMCQEMKKKLGLLEEENLQLKKRITPSGEREKGAVFLIEITGLQAKLAQRDLEIKEMQRKLNDAGIGLTSNRHETTVPSSEAGISGFSNYAPTEKKYDTLAQRYKRQWDEEDQLHQQELNELRGIRRNREPPSNEPKEIYKLRRDLKEIKQALDSIVKGQKEKPSEMLQNGFASLLEEKESELIRQESLYKQIMKTRENLFSEILKEKNQIIQMLTDQNHKTGSQDFNATADKIKAFIKNEWKPLCEEMKTQIENVIRTKSSGMFSGEIATDAVKNNEARMARIEKCTDEVWMKVRDELAEIKDFTFEMADAIEKDIFSSHEQFLDFFKCTSDDIVRRVTDEGNVTRKTVLDQFHATRQSLDVMRYEEFHNSLDSFGKCTSRELRQARRDVLLAAKAVTKTADELHHLKTSLDSKLSINDVMIKDELTKRIQLVNATEEVKDLKQTVSDVQSAAQTLKMLEHEYTHKAKNIESNLTRKEIQLAGIANAEQEDVIEKDISSADIIRRTAVREILHGCNSLGDAQSPSLRNEDEPRPNPIHLTSQAPPSRDYVTLRERLQKKARERLPSDCFFQEPITTSSAGSTVAW